MSFIVLDASFLIRLLLASSPESPPARLYRTWRAKRRPLAAPSLALYEGANVLYRYALAGEMTLSEAKALLHLGLGLGVHFLNETWVHAEAMDLAHVLGLKATYDAHYLALAKGFGADFWTADKKLYQRILEAQKEGLLSVVRPYLLETP